MLSQSNDSMGDIAKVRMDSALQAGFRQAIVWLTKDNSRLYTVNHLMWGLYDSSESHEDFVQALKGLDIDIDALMEQVNLALRPNTDKNPPKKEDGVVRIMLELNEEMSRLFSRLLESFQSSGRPQTVQDAVRLIWSMQLGVFGEPVVYTSQGQHEAGSAADSGAKKPTSMKFRVLHMLGEDMMEAYENGKIDPVIGREKEVDQLMESVLRWKKSAPILVGSPGVGKTAVVEGLVHRIVTGDVPECLKDVRIWSISPGALSSGTAMKGAFEQRVQDLIADMEEFHDRVILFVDEIHGLFGSGSTSDVMSNPASMMKPALSRGRMRIIGATTDSDMSKMIQRDAALMRRFQSIQVNELSRDDSIKIGLGLRETYIMHHNVDMPEEMVIEAQRFAERYLSDRPNPDRLLDVMDVALAKAQFRSADVLAVEDIVAATSSLSGVPISSRGGDGLNDLLDRVKKSVIGQVDPISRVVGAVRRHRVGLSDPSRPAGVFMLAGPTGVGKTELAKAVAREAFGSEDALIRFDMSEFKEPHQVSRLIGSPPGYVGSQEGGLLVEAVRKRPHSVLLLDEFEKADDRVFDLFLQVFDDARITDGLGRTAAFGDVLILMTSNIGSTAGKSIGFSDNSSDPETRALNINQAISQRLRPEFINRFDDILVFDPIGRDQMASIVDVELAKRGKMLMNARRIVLDVDDAAKVYLQENGYNEEFGVRPLRRLVEREVILPISDLLVDGAAVDGDTIQVTADVSGIKVFVKS